MPPTPTGLTPPAAPSPPPGDQPPVPFIDAGYGEAGPDDDTAPIPVILHGGHAGGREPAAPPSSPDNGDMRLRGPFEPPRRGDPATAGGPVLSSTLEQIKDLYLTAEAIGEDALDKHFELVSDRQRKLITEYFEKAVAGRPEGQDPEYRPS